MKFRTGLCWISIVIVIFLLIWVVNVFFLFQVTVTDDALSPNLRKGDRVLVNRIAYLKRGDIVVYKNPMEEVGLNMFALGRCFALPGDTLWIFLSQGENASGRCGVWKSIVVPCKRMKIKVEPWNIQLLSNALYTFERKNVCAQCDSVLVVNGIPKKWVTFSSDYIWLRNKGGNTRMLGSEMLGFIPLSSVLGVAEYISYSFSSSKKELSFSRTGNPVSQKVK